METDGSRWFIDIRKHNSSAWDKEVARRNPWTIPVALEVTARAREGDWSILLTPTEPMPGSWFPPLAGARVLCLASGGGQLEAGFFLCGFYEDSTPGEPLADYLPTFIATRAVKPPREGED